MGYFLEWKIITCFISKSKIYDYLYNKYFRLAPFFFLGKRCYKLTEIIICADHFL